MTGTTFEVDNTAPTVAITYQEITDNASTPTSGYLSSLAHSVRGAKSVAIEVTATEAGGSATLTGSPTVTVTPSGGSATTVTLTETSSGSKIWRGVYDVPSTGSDGTATVALTVSGIADEAGNVATSTGQTTSFVIDNTAPSVAITYQEITDNASVPTSGYLASLATPVRGAKSVAIQVTATETGGGATLTGSPTVTVTPSGGSATTVTLTETSSGSKVWRGVYDVPSSGSDGSATVALTVSGISDESGNVAAVASSQTTSFTIDNTTPTVVLTYSDNGSSDVTGPYKSGDSVTVTATFTETNALSGTPTLTLTTGTFTGGTLPSVTLSGSGLVYTGTFTIPVGDGTVTASVGTVDTAGNTLTATGQTGFTIDNTTPTATLTYALDASSFASSLTRPAKSGDTVTVKATFTESIALYGTPTLTLTQDGDATVPSANTAMTATASSLA
ncbi:MAG: hypothetical protein EBT22_12680, partial [Chloroflexi bacterium]|nr:hypothetical protein [Chloroflexota bacterium]